MVFKDINNEHRLREGGEGIQKSALGLRLKSIWKVQLMQKVQAVLDLSRVAPKTFELHWVLICFLVQFKMLVITSKAPHGMGLGYLQNSLAPISLAHPTLSIRAGMSWTLTVKRILTGGV